MAARVLPHVSTSRLGDGIPIPRFGAGSTAAIAAPFKQADAVTSEKDLNGAYGEPHAQVEEARHDEERTEVAQSPDARNQRHERQRTSGRTSRAEAHAHRPA